MEAGVPFEDCSAVYRRSRNFDTLAKNLAKEVLARAKGVHLCYCVDGGVSEDRAARILMQREDVVVIDGVSKAEKVAARAGLCGAYTACSAYEVEGRVCTLPLVVYDLDDRALAGDVKLALVERFGDEAPALFLNGEEVRSIPLYELDRQSDYGAGCALVLPEEDLLEKQRFDFDDLIAVLKRLRAPDGCPWDRVQTHESIRINAIEEAYELVDAIDRGDEAGMQEEAGDVIMQAAFHTLIEEERGNFTVGDVLTELCRKLIDRHTHVFGQDRAEGEGGALSVWDKNKMKEKHQDTFSASVNDVPACFPALLRAQKIAKRVEKGGWTCAEGEAESALQAALKGLLAAADKEARSACMGEALFALCRMARSLGVEAEMSLLDTAKRIQAEYTAWEGLVLADGKDVLTLTEEEKRGYHVRVKQRT